jgi:hypothetical protein
MKPRSEMAILRGFPPSNLIQEGIRLPVECEDCGVESYFVNQRNPRGGWEPPFLPEKWVYLCDECAVKRQHPIQLLFKWE